MARRYRFVFLKSKILTLLSICILLIVAGASANQSPECLECHSEYADNLAATFHSEADTRVEVSCISCHVNYKAHLEEPDPSNITIPSELDPFEELDVCSSCHFGQSESDFVHAGKHFTQGVNCSGCHTIHGNANVGTALLKSKNIVETCANCHRKQLNDFSLLSSHPVKAGAITCIDCHELFTDLGYTLAARSANGACYKCHTEMDGPFMYEHEATRDFGLVDGGCLNCHIPHGSAFPNLLKEPVQQLCQQCHVLPPGHATAHNSTTCLDCHIDIHGSDTDSRFLHDRPQSTINEMPCQQCHQ